MEMKKIFIVDTDKRFQAQIHEVCPADLVELRFFSSGMEIFLLLTTEKPHLLFLDLDIDDLNEFVMRDLLKKITVTYAIPLLVTYSDKSEAALKQYEKLNYRPDGYFKKPLTPEHLKELIYRYLQLQEEVKSDETDTLMEFTPPTLPAKEGDLVEFGETIEDEEDSFSDENLDLLVRGGAVDTGEDLAPITPKEKDGAS